MNKMKYALIGCGKVAAKHLKAALYHTEKRGNIEIAALVDNRPEAAHALMEKINLPDRIRSQIRIYTDYVEMLEQEKPQLTAITTPSGSHAVMGLRAISAGSNILLEKPLTLSLAEADQLLEAAARQNVRIAVGHIYRFFPVVAELQKDLQSGRFGRILYGDVKVRWGHDQAYYDQAAWRGTWSHDGGALMNQSIHALDLMVWLLGQPVRSVNGRIDRQLHRMQAEDFGLASLELNNGIWCQLEGTTNTDPKRQEASFFIRCTGGEIRAGIMAGKPYMKIIDGQGKNLSGKYLRSYLAAKWREGRLAAIKQLGNPHSGLYGDWIAAASYGIEPLADGKCGRDAVEMVLAIYKSALLKHQVDLPLREFKLEEMALFFPNQP